MPLISSSSVLSSRTLPLELSPGVEDIKGTHGDSGTFGVVTTVMPTLELNPLDFTRCCLDIRLTDSIILSQSGVNPPSAPPS